jgi:two-component system sensor histidine kinase RegB
MSHIDNKTVYQLIWLRGIAVFLQLLTLIIAEVAMGISLPITSMLVIIFIYLAFHLFVWHRFQSGRSVTQLAFFTHLMVDVFVLCGLLYYAGGATNPFISLLLFPLTITATVLTSRYTWLMAIVTISAYSALMQFHISLPYNHAAGNEFSLHIFGMWFGFILSAALVSFFIVSMRKSLYQKDQQLHDVHEQTLKDQQLISLATLSASTAHELGTPLGTISLLSDELEFEIEDEEIKRELLHPLKQQLKRCKEILSVLSAKTGGIYLDSGSVEAVGDFIKQLIDNWQLTHPNSKIKLTISDSKSVPKILTERVIVQAISNILDNAWRESKQLIECDLSWDNSNISLVINDLGPGLDNELLHLMGKQPCVDSKDGMGLGLFLSHTIVERMGGKIIFANREPKGLSTQIILPIRFIS